MLLTLSTVAQSVAQNIDEHQWQHRLLLITGIDAHEPEVKKAMDRLSHNEEALLDRRIIMYQITPTSFRRYNETNWHQSDEVFNSYVRGDEKKGRVILVGLDGGVKERYPIEVKPAQIWADIDRMPMRRSEIRSGRPD